MNLFSRSSQTPPDRPCGCNPPVYCTEAEGLIRLVERGARVAGETGSWIDHTRAVVELARHLDRETDEIRAMLRHPAGR